MEDALGRWKGGVLVLVVGAVVNSAFCIVRIKVGDECVCLKSSMIVHRHLFLIWAGIDATRLFFRFPSEETNNHQSPHHHIQVQNPPSYLPLNSKYLMCKHSSPSANDELENSSTVHMRSNAIYVFTSAPLI